MIRHFFTFLSLVFWGFIPENLNSQNWQAVPLVSELILSHGQIGGEGCQVIQAIEADHTDGSFLLMGTDVGGIYRSIDGGQHWAPCNIGYFARGNAGFAIDPNNSDRALAVGANSISNNAHGLYLTTNRGASWNSVLSAGSYAGQGSLKDKVEFVKASFDSSLNQSMLAFWSSPGGGIFRSLDGGESWVKVNSDFGDCNLKVNPASGAVYIVNADGFYKSSDSAHTFVKKFDGIFTDMDVVDSLPDHVYLTSTDKLYVSLDGGENFTQVSNASCPKNMITLNVSPADPSRILVCNKENDWGGPVYLSEDGGQSWKLSPLNNDDAFMPYNTRVQKFAWHPKDPQKVWAKGGDWISSSKNGGRNFYWDANGYNGILVGGMFNFNPRYPQILFVASQDYNGAFTSDGGHSWIYCNPSHLGWGGFTYGAYAANPNVLVTQNSSGWGVNGYITISRDGGKSFTQTGLLCTGLDVGCGDPRDTNIIYFSNYRSLDLGETWSKMSGCQGVLCANTEGDRELYGANGHSLVRSVDYGASWTVLKNFASNVIDAALDQRTGKLYVVTEGDRAYTLEAGVAKEITGLVPADQYNIKAIQAIAIDPQNPDMVYLAGAKNVYKSDASIKRSNDGGASWEIFMPNTRTVDSPVQADGVNEVIALRVNPASRELWAAGSCYGIWKDKNIDKNTLDITSPVVSDQLMVGDSVHFLVNEVINADSFLHVQFFLGDSLLATDSLAPYAFSFKIETAGELYFKAVGEESGGGKIYAPVVNINVHASLSPVVTLINPVNDSIYPENASLILQVQANDPDGSLEKVEYFVNGVKIGESDAEPFSLSWNNTVQGTNTFTALVTDNSGEKAQSPPVHAVFFGKEGMVNYYEDFNDGIAQKWKTISGTWLVSDNEYSNTTASGAYMCVYDGGTFSYYTFMAKGRASWGNDFGFIFNWQDSKNYYLLSLDTDPQTATLKIVKNGSSRTLKSAAYTGGGMNAEVTVSITNKSGYTTVIINGHTIFDQEPTPDIMYGKIGLYTFYNPVYFDDLQVMAAASVYTGTQDYRLDEAHFLKITQRTTPAPYCEISLPSKQNSINYTIIDLTGRSVFSGCAMQTNGFRLDDSVGLKPGIYLIQVQTESFSTSIKICWQ